MTLPSRGKFADEKFAKFACQRAVFGKFMVEHEFEQRIRAASWRRVVASRGGVAWCRVVSCGVVWCRVVSSRRGHALWLPEVLTAPRAVVAWSRGVVVSRGGFLTAS